MALTWIAGKMTTYMKLLRNSGIMFYFPILKARSSLPEKVLEKLQLRWIPLIILLYMKSLYSKNVDCKGKLHHPGCFSGTHLWGLHKNPASTGSDMPGWPLPCVLSVTSWEDFLLASIMERGKLISEWTFFCVYYCCLSR